MAGFESTTLYTHLLLLYLCKLISIHNKEIFVIVIENAEKNIYEPFFDVVNLINLFFNSIILNRSKNTKQDYNIIFPHNR